MTQLPAAASRPDIVLVLADDHQGIPVPAPEGTSLMPALRGEHMEHGPLYWEHKGNAAVRDGRWKLVRKYGEPWRLHDMDVDRSEMTGVSGDFPAIAAHLVALYEGWARRVGVIPRERILAARERHGRATQDPRLSATGAEPARNAHQGGSA